MQRHPVIGHLRELLGCDLQLARRLLDERAGSPAAGRLHVDLLGYAIVGRREEDRLHVFAADLGDEAHVGMEFLRCRGNSDDLLHHPTTDKRRNEPRAGPGEDHAVLAGREAGLVLEAGEEVQGLFGLPRVVPLIILPADFTILDQHGLDRRRTNIDSRNSHSDLPSSSRMTEAAKPAAPRDGMVLKAPQRSGLCASLARAASTVRPVTVERRFELLLGPPFGFRQDHLAAGQRMDLGVALDFERCIEKVWIPADGRRHGPDAHRIGHAPVGRKLADHVGLLVEMQQQRLADQHVTFAAREA